MFRRLAADLVCLSAFTEIPPAVIPANSRQLSKGWAPKFKYHELKYQRVQFLPIF